MDFTYEQCLKLSQLITFYNILLKNRRHHLGLILMTITIKIPLLYFKYKRSHTYKPKKFSLCQVDKKNQSLQGHKGLMKKCGMSKPGKWETVRHHGRITSRTCVIGSYYNLDFILKETSLF